MRVRVLMFASLKDIVGSKESDVELRDGSTVADLSTHLMARYPPLKERLPRVRIAVNEALADAARSLAEGDEVAYLPPVSGGAGPAHRHDFAVAPPAVPHIALVEGEISLDGVLASVRRPDCGAVLLFLGTVRDSFRGKAVLGMEYEAHKALAEHMLIEVAAEAQQRWPVRAVSIVHRSGRMAVGEVSVAVAVAAPHRPEAFEAGRYLIDRLKEYVPIWKKEFLEDGEVWIEGDERVPRAPHEAHKPPRER